MTIRTTTRLLLLAPIAWIPVALVHPMGGESAYEALHDRVGLWVGIHFVQLALSLGVAALLWCLLADLTTRGARAARVSLPIYLVTFAAYDGITGIGSGLVVNHANGASGAARDGAADAANYLLMNQISADLSPLHVISSIALVVAVIGTALALHGARCCSSGLAAGRLRRPHHHARRSRHGHRRSVPGGRRLAGNSGDGSRTIRRCPGPTARLS